MASPCRNGNSVPTLRLSHKMILALERLYETNGQADYVAYSTAIALKVRQLVSMPRNPSQRTGAGASPEYLTALTNEGGNWCTRHFAQLRALESKRTADE